MTSTDQPTTVRYESPNPDHSFDMPIAAHAALIAMLAKRAAERQS